MYPDKMKNRDLPDFMAATLDCDPANTRTFARFLRDAGVLPSDQDAPAKLEYAVDLMLALLGASCPAEAAAASRNFGSLPAQSVTPIRAARDGSAQFLTPIPIAHVRLTSVAKETQRLLRRSLRDFLVVTISDTRLSDDDPPGADALRLISGANAPMAVASIGLHGTDDDGHVLFAVGPSPVKRLRARMEVVVPNAALRPLIVEWSMWSPHRASPQPQTVEDESCRR